MSCHHLHTVSVQAVDFLGWLAPTERRMVTSNSGGSASSDMLLVMDRGSSVMRVGDETNTGKGECDQSVEERELMA